MLSLITPREICPLTRTHTPEVRTGSPSTLPHNHQPAQQPPTIPPSATWPAHRSTRGPSHASCAASRPPRLVPMYPPPAHPSAYSAPSCRPTLPTSPPHPPIHPRHTPRDYGPPLPLLLGPQRGKGGRADLNRSWMYREYVGTVGWGWWVCVGSGGEGRGGMVGRAAGWLTGHKWVATVRVRAGGWLAARLAGSVER